MILRFPLPSDGPVLPQSSRQMIQGLSDERCHPGLRLDRYAFAGTMEEQRGVLESLPLQVMPLCCHRLLNAGVLQCPPLARQVL